jgi:hypothetical protein
MDNIRSCPYRFTRPVFLWALAALIADLAVEWLPKHVLHREAPRLLTLLPLILVAFFWVSLVRMILKMDELQKRIWYESVFIAFMATLAVTFGYAGLQRAGIIHAPWDDMGSFMMFIWGLSYIYCAERYK